ncbi:hypothetical protein H6P81_013628 [Aristolochia fimbriata]|uniref:Uncharacterized protein n=1 Tax=Aristolochia fimbriata TaxID=158543 RepID=A0AAV7EF98_ARIFI|nr:hypothetical protein H6P81_013628 [Aristolochia fimbriata]
MPVGSAAGIRVNAMEACGTGYPPSYPYRKKPNLSRGCRWSDTAPTPTAKKPRSRKESLSFPRPDSLLRSPEPPLEEALNYPLLPLP